MTTLERIQPYVEQIFDDDDVRANVARMTANLRAARKRAASRKGVRQAAEDPGVRARLVDGARAGRAAVLAIREAPQKRQSPKRQSPWPRRVRLVLAMAAAAGAGVAYQSRRAHPAA
jgi:hypothetical protein